MNSNRIEIQDTNGKSLGYLTDFSGDGYVFGVPFGLVKVLTLRGFITRSTFNCGFDLS